MICIRPRTHTIFDLGSNPKLPQLPLRASSVAIPFPFLSFSRSSAENKAPTIPSPGPSPYPSPILDKVFGGLIACRPQYRSIRPRCRRATMGCAGSTAAQLEENTKKIQKPKPWKHPQPITPTQLKQMRDEFWDTAPHYGGQKEIWDALRAAAEADLNLAQVIVDSAGIIISNADLTLCYDERGAKYELPKYVLSDPTNLIREN